MSTAPGLQHIALLYSTDGFPAGTLPFFQSGLNNGESVLVLTDAGNIDLLADALGHEKTSPT